MASEKKIFIVDGTRTPFLKAKGPRGPFTASDLAVQAGRDLLSRQPFSPTEIGEVVLGCMLPSENEANIARIVALRLGCGKKVPAYTVQRNCASGMQSIDSAIKDIQLGRHDLVLAGGCEAMSHSPLLFRPEMVNWFARYMRAKTVGAKLQSISHIRPHYFKPIIALLCGLSDPLYGINMGQTAELLAHQFNVTREEMDAFAVQSQLRLAQAQKDQVLTEISTLYDHAGHFYDHDDGVRPNSTIELLAKLKPNFDRKFGRVTPANSSQITDGAAMLLLASEEAVKKHKLSVMGHIADTHWAATSPEVMGLGPVMSSVPLMQRNKLKLDDIDYWEINEAFAAQVLACLNAFDSQDFCKEHFGMTEPVGMIDQARLNVEGGAIGVGHPIGATGARIVLHLLHVLKRNKAKRGIATLCIGGGQGGAMLVETA